jgi:hypothetical protein
MVNCGYRTCENTVILVLFNYDGGRQTDSGSPSTPSTLADRFILAKSKRPSAHSSPQPSHPSAKPSGEGSSAEPALAQSLALPSLWKARILSWLVVLHFLLIGLSYLSFVAPSMIQARMLDFWRPYLAILHLDADGVPLLFSDASKAEKTHRLLKSPTERSADDGDWKEIESQGIVGGDRQRRQQRWLALLAELGENEKGALAAWLIEPIALTNATAQRIRITREPDLMTTTVDDATPPPYTGVVVRDATGSVRMVQSPPSRLAAPVVKAPVVEGIDG